jgi:hypothetical protein
MYPNFAALEMLRYILMSKEEIQLLPDPEQCDFPGNAKRYNLLNVNSML